MNRWMSIPQAPRMPVATECGLAEVNGINMYFATYGSGTGTPILMIHGGLAHSDMWASQVIDLMKDHKVIVADTRGHGRSTNDGSAYAYDLLAQDYLALLDHLKVKSAHLVGWSDGANIGYVISNTAPDQLASHFAHAGNVTLDGLNPPAETDPVFVGYISMMGKDYAAMSPTPDKYEAFIGDISEMQGKPGGFDQLAKITVPTFIVQSEHDEAILEAHAQKIAETIPSAKYQALKGASHFAAFQAPGEYTSAIRDFIKQPGKKGCSSSQTRISAPIFPSVQLDGKVPDHSTYSLNRNGRFPIARERRDNNKKTTGGSRAVVF